MKKLIALIILFSFFACNNQNDDDSNNIVISGIIKNVPKNTFVKFFLRTEYNTVYIDSTLIIDSTFEFKTEAHELNFYGLQFSKNNYTIYLLLDSGQNVIINADYQDLQSYKVKNSSHSQIIMQFENNLNDFNKQLNALYEKKQSADSLLSKIRKNTELKAYELDSSPAIIILFSEKFNNNEIVLPIEKYYSLYKDALKKMQKHYSNYYYYNNLKDFVKNYEIQKRRSQTIDNQTLPKYLVDFKTKTIEGKDFSLKSFKGNWILLDFWATWSESCSKNNIFIKNLQTEFPKLKIVQIALDKNAKNVSDTIAKYGLNQTIIVENQIWNSQIVDKYLVEELPCYVLIDSKAKIVSYTTDSKEIEHYLKTHSN